MVDDTGRPQRPASPEVLYGTQTRLSLRHFGARGRRVGDVRALVRHYALIKKAAAIVNRRLGVVDDARAAAIVTACDEVAAGLHDAQFPTAIVLGGGGTTTNMNVNEVIAARATRVAGMAVHPNDHVNASQSTNDTIPTAMALTTMDLATGPLAALDTLATVLTGKADEYADTVYLGRTCLQDAITVRAGRTLRAQARAVRRGIAELRDATGALAELPLGATVLGTSIGAPDGFAEAAVTELKRLVAPGGASGGVSSGPEVAPAPDLYDALAHLDRYAAVADAAARGSVTVAKIAADLRLRSSGPGGGFAEVSIPALQAGSSIMPAKINPVVPELAMQLSYRIRGAAHTVSCAVAAGELEVNVMEPVIFDSVITIFEDLEQAATAMATLCVNGLRWDGARRAENAGHALDHLVELASRSGYETATDSARSAARPGPPPHSAEPAS